MAVSSARRDAAQRLGLRPGLVAAAALAVLAILLGLNLAAIFYLDSGGGKRIARLFIFDAEANFPTLFNYLLLVGIAALLALLAVRAFGEGSRWRYHWAGLALIFLVFSYDEAARMHEALVPLVNRFVDAKGVLYFSWVVPGAIFALLVGLAYLRFVLALPRPIAALTILGGGLYIAGALGLELASGEYVTRHGMETSGFLLLATVEETLEMLGLIVFGYGLLRLLAGADGRLRLAPRA